MKNENIIEPIPEMVVDTRKLTEIRFDCLVTVHDVGFKKYKGVWGQQKQSRNPQWFRAQTQLTLEMIKFSDEYTIGRAVKQLFYDLERNIDKYENS